MIAITFRWPNGVIQNCREHVHRVLIIPSKSNKVVPLHIESHINLTSQYLPNMYAISVMGDTSFVVFTSSLPGVSVVLFLFMR